MEGHNMSDEHPERKTYEQRVPKRWASTTTVTLTP